MDAFTLELKSIEKAFGVLYVCLLRLKKGKKNEKENDEAKISMERQKKSIYRSWDEGECKGSI